MQVSRLKKVDSKSRFKTFEEAIYESMQVFDPCSWDCTNNNYGVEEIQKFATRFSKTLSVAGFEADKRLPEWEAFKFFCQHAFEALGGSALWH